MKEIYTDSTDYRERLQDSIEGYLRQTYLYNQNDKDEIEWIVAGVMAFIATNAMCETYYQFNECQTKKWYEFWK